MEWCRVQQLLVEFSHHINLFFSLSPLPCQGSPLFLPHLSGASKSPSSPPTRTRCGAVLAEETRERRAVSRLSSDSSRFCLPSARGSRTCIPPPGRTGPDAFARSAGFQSASSSSILFIPSSVSVRSLGVGVLFLDFFFGLRIFLEGFNLRCNFPEGIEIVLI